MLNWLPVFAFDIFSVFGTLGCVFEEWSYHQELLFATLWPAAVIGALLSVGHACGLDTRAIRGYDTLRARTEYLALFVSFLLFPRTSVVVFAAFRCDEVEMGVGSESSAMRVLLNLYARVACLRLCCLFCASRVASFSTLLVACAVCLLWGRAALGCGCLKSLLTLLATRRD